MRFVIHLFRLCSRRLGKPRTNRDCLFDVLAISKREFAFPKDASVIEQEACHTKKSNRGDIGLAAGNPAVVDRASISATIRSIFRCSQGFGMLGRPS
jgi:hypothetical protein